MRDPCMITHSFLVGSLAECVQKQTVKNRKKIFIPHYKVHIVQVYGPMKDVTVHIQK